MNRPVPAIEEEGVLRREGRPYVSFSRINRYLHCPEQYRLYYVEGLRPRFPAASLVFGQVVHQALAHLFRTGEDPAARFLTDWEEARQLDLSYSQRDSWEKLRDTGRTLLGRFADEELPRLGKVESSERAFEVEVTGLDLPFVGVIDLIADVDGKKTVVDFKTAGSDYEPHEVLLSDQLTAYLLAEAGIEQAALCVLVKSREPKIAWHFSRRSGADIASYLAKVGYLAREIEAGRFFKRPGKWCAWCDYLPVCMGDAHKVKETLIAIS